MTLIGLFVYNNYVTIISDILLSGNPRFNDPIAIPSIGDRCNKEDSVFIDNLEKIYMFSSKSLIGFAGNPFHAQECIKEIQLLNDLNNLNAINEIIKKYKEKGRFDCIYVNKNDGKVNLLATSEIFEDFSNFNYVCAIGTGTSNFLKYLRNIDENFKNYLSYLQDKEIYNKVSNIEVRIFLVFQVLIEFYKDDFIQNGISLQKRYGGYYELILEYQDHFRKLSNYHLCIWSYRKNNLELKTKYHSIYKENGLYISKLDFVGKSYTKEEYKLKKLEDYYSNLEKGNNTNNKDYNLEYDGILSIVFTFKEKNIISNVKFLIGSSSFEKSIKLETIDGNVIKYEIMPEFKKQILSLISLREDSKQKTILEAK